LSLKIFLVNTILVLISFIVFYTTGNEPGPADTAAALSLFYIIVSFIPSTIGVLVGVYESSKTKKYSVFGIICNFMWVALVLSGIFMAGRYA